MLRHSKFVAAAVAKPYHYYFSTLSVFSPIHIVGLAVGVILSGRIALKLFFVCDQTWAKFYSRQDDIIAVLLLWPLGFLVGLTILGVLGAGFQTRFLAPILPATSILGSYCAINGQHTMFIGLFSLLLAYSAIHFFVYGILLAPLLADLDYSVWNIIYTIIISPYHSPETTDKFVDVLKFLKHYGITINFSSY